MEALAGAKAVVVARSPVMVVVVVAAAVGMAVVAVAADVMAPEVVAAVHTVTRKSRNVT